MLFGASQSPDGAIVGVKEHATIVAAVATDLDDVAAPQQAEVHGGGDVALSVLNWLAQVASVCLSLIHI